MATKTDRNNAQMFKQAIVIEKERALTKEERDQEIAEVFNMFDKNGDGKLLNSEIDAFLRAIGQDPNQDDVNKLVETIDLDKNGYITLDEFMIYMDDAFVISQDQIDELIDAFKIFDFDNSGSISREEFKNILIRYGKDEFSEENINDIFSMIDSDNNGLINYAEFIDMWKYQ